jgi:hypothetical protein
LTSTGGVGEQRNEHSWPADDSPFPRRGRISQIAVAHSSPFPTERGSDNSRNPIVIEQVTDIAVRTDNLDAAFV